MLPLAPEVPDSGTFPQSVKDWAMHSFNSVHGFFVSWPLAADWRAAGMKIWFWLKLWLLKPWLSGRLAR